ncbi:MAG: hypothetical protein WBC89_00800 [Dehalococcoidia bacterium]
MQNERLSRFYTTLFLDTRAESKKGLTGYSTRVSDLLPEDAFHADIGLWLVKLVAHHERAKRVEWWAILDLNQ